MQQRRGDYIFMMFWITLLSANHNMWGIYKINCTCIHFYRRKMFLVFPTAGFDRFSFIFVPQTVAGMHLHFQTCAEDLSQENFHCKSPSLHPPLQMGTTILHVDGDFPSLSEITNRCPGCYCPTHTLLHQRSF